MLKNCLFLFGLLCMISCFSQNREEQTLGKLIEDLTYAWDQESLELDNYDGFRVFCTDKDYGGRIVKMLKDIHHYDSVLYIRLSQALRFSNDKEIKKTIKDIETFELEYDMHSFIAFLDDECMGIAEIEKNKEDLEDEIGQESYDGRRYVMETELSKYIHHITKRVDLLREHVHHLHIE